MYNGRYQQHGVHDLKGLPLIKRLHKFQGGAGGGGGGQENRPLTEKAQDRKSNRTQLKIKTGDRRGEQISRP